MSYFKKYQWSILLFCITFFVIFIYKFPDIYAYFNIPKDMVFLGQNPWFDGEDVNVYASAIRYGQLGHILLPNLYTSIPNQPVFIYPFYTVLGFIFQAGNPFLIFFVASLTMGILLVNGFYFILKSLGLSVKLSLFSCLAICLGGGFGFIVFPHVYSADITQAITFYDTFLKPHEGLALFSYILSLVIFYKVFIRQFSSKYHKLLLVTMASALALATVMYAYLLLSYFLITFCFFMFKKKGQVTSKEYLSLAIVYIPAGCIALTMANQFASNPTFSGLLQHLDVDIGLLIPGYGILLLLLLYQLIFLKKSQLEKYLLVWIIIMLTLALLPIGPARLFLRGLFFPLVLNGVLVMQTLLDKYNIHKNLHRRLVFCFFLVFVIGTSIDIFMMRVQNVTAYPPSQSASWVYMSQNDYQVFNYLNTHTPFMSSVLGGYRLGNQVPAFTHNSVYFGLLPNTAKDREKFNNMQLFFGGKVPKDMVDAIFKGNNISYVIWGPEEKDITSKEYKKIDSLADLYKDLTLIYTSSNISLYATNSK